MLKQRKTEDQYEIQQYTGPTYGWECVNTETTYRAAKTSITEYRENSPGEYRIRHKLVKITPKPDPMVKVLLIDAWRSCDGGWDWNNWRKVGEVPSSWIDLFPKHPRALLHRLRNEGWGWVPGQVYVEDDGYNLVIKQRSDHMPRYALAYGELEFEEARAQTAPSA